MTRIKVKRKNEPIFKHGQGTYLTACTVFTQGAIMVEWLRILVSCEKGDQSVASRPGLVSERRYAKKWKWTISCWRGRPFISSAYDWILKIGRFFPGSRCLIKNDRAMTTDKRRENTILDQTILT